MALTKPFAENGDKKAIPQTTSDGSVSFDRGFGSFYALPPEEGGLFIDRAQFNQLMFDTTSAVISNQNSITTLNSKVANIESGVSAGVVNLTGNQTIAGIKTFSSPVVVPNATANTHAVNLAQLNTKANQATTYTKAETYTKTEVDDRVNGRATWDYSYPKAETYTKIQANNLLNTKIDSTKATKLLTENLVKTVGASGADFANLRQALEWASQYSYSGGRFKITLRCNADMPIPGVYLPIGEALIVIDGQNNTFNCDNSYFFTASMNSTENNGGIFNSNITIKNFILNYNRITTSAYGCAFQLAGINVTFDNIKININNSNIGNLIVFSCLNCLISNLSINCSGTNISGSVIYAASSTVQCATPTLNLSNLTEQITALFLFSNSKAIVNSNKNIPLPTDKIQTHITVYDGSLVSCNNEFSKFSQAPNTLTANGIIFKS